MAGLPVARGSRSVSELLYGALRLYLDRFRPMYLVALAGGVIGGLPSVFGRRVPIALPAPRAPTLLMLPLRTLLATFWWPSLVWWLAGLLVAICVMLLADQAISRPDDSPLPLGPTVSTALRRLWPAVAAAVLTGLGSALAFIALVVPGYFLWTRWSVSRVAVVVENRSATAAMGRSYALVRGCFWHAFGATMFGGLLAGMATLLLDIPLRFSLPGTLGPAPLLLWSAVAHTVVTPYVPCLLVLLYHDLVARQEAPAPRRDTVI